MRANAELFQEPGTEVPTCILEIDLPRQVMNLKNVWITILKLPEKYLEQNPKEKRLHDARVKVLNKAFMAQEYANSALTFIPFGTKIQVETEQIITNKK